MPIAELSRAIGAGFKVYADSVSVANGGTVNTGLSVIYSAVVSSSNDAHIASVNGINGGTITIGLADNGGNAVTTAETVYIIAIGQ